MVRISVYTDTPLDTVNSDYVSKREELSAQKIAKWPHFLMLLKCKFIFRVHDKSTYKIYKCVPL